MQRALVVLVFLCLLAGQAGAADFTVATSGQLSAAIEEANGNGEEDTITIVVDSIEVESALPAISGSLTIIGQPVDGGSPGTTIDGGQVGRVLEVTSGEFELRNVTVVQGLAQGADGTAVSPAGDPGEGGGLRIGDADVTLVNTNFSENTAQGGDGLAGDPSGDGGDALGGAIFLETGRSLAIVDSDFGTLDFDEMDDGGLNEVVAGEAGDLGSPGTAAGQDLYLVDASSSVVFEVTQSTDTRRSLGSIAGAGSLEKDGPGTLRLESENNSYSGGTTIATGTLEGNPLSLPGDFTVEAGATLGFVDLDPDDEDPDRDFDGKITGDGGVAKSGDNTITLTNPDNDYEGDTVIRAGTLAGNPQSLPGDVTVEAGATLGFVELSGDGDLEFDGSITGQGAVEKSGDNTITLSKPNDYSGGTKVLGGALKGDSDALQGDFELSDNTQLMFHQTGTGTHSGNITGSGGLVKARGGKLVLSGENTFTGAVTVKFGTLQGDTRSLPDVAYDLELAASVLVFDQPAGQDGTFSGTTTGLGSLVKQGDGELSVSGTLGHKGGTTVSAGRFNLTGKIENNDGGIAVASGGDFGGDGSIGDGMLVVQGGGRVTPGLADAIGTLSVQDVDFRAGSILSVDADYGSVAADSDLLKVTGSADLDATPVVTVNLSFTDFVEHQTFTILSAGTLIGGFASTSASELPFFDTTVASVDAMDAPCDPSCMPGKVVLTVRRNENAYADVAETPNQRAVATALDEQGIPPTGNDDLDFVLGEILTLSTTAEVQDAYDQIGGEGISSWTTAQLANGEKFSRTVMSRLGVVGGRALGTPGTADLIAELAGGDSLRRGGDLLESLPIGAPTSTLLVAALGPAVVSLPPERGRFGLWVDGYGVFGGVDGDANSADTDWTTGGVSAGFDARLGEHGILGLAAGYAYLDVNVDARRFDGEANVFQGGLYGSFVSERFFFGALGRYAFSDFQHRRRLRFGDVDHGIKASYDGHEAGVYAEGGVVAFDPAGIQIEPMASLNYTWLERDGFAESGSSPGHSMNLDVASQSWNSVLGAVGLRLHRRFRIGEAAPLLFIPEIWARYAHQFGDRDRPLDAAISGAVSGGAFRLTGATAARDGVLVGVGWSMNRGDDLSFLVHYDLGWNPDLLNHAIALGLLFRF